MTKKNHTKIAFNIASSEVNFLSRQFIKIIELITGKIKLKKLYDQYLLENNSPENFWHDSVSKLKFDLKTYFIEGSVIPRRGRLIIDHTIFLIFFYLLKVQLFL